MYRLGKLPVNPDHVKKALKFADYVPAVLPPIPGSFSNLSNVFASLGMQNTSSNIPVLFPLDGNGPDPSVPTTTGYGDCVMAMFAHWITLCCGLLGIKNVPTPQQVVAAYLKLSPNDDGLNISNVIDITISSGLLGEKPGAKVYIDPSNWDHMRLAMYMFGGLLGGIQCTDAMQTQFSNGQPWDGSGTV